MNLPYANHVIIDNEKIKGYCLNPEHPRGKHKARVFKDSLGLTSKNTESLIAKIRNGISKAECKKGVLDEYGQRYTVDIEIENNFKKAVIRTSWIIKRNETRPRLTTCYVK